MVSNLKERVKTILKRLKPFYGKDPIEIHYKTPFQLVVGVILSAQCTDERVNKVTATFFDKYKTARDFLKLTPSQLEKMIQPTGFYRNKAKSILGAARLIAKEHGGKIPKSLDALVKLPGFGRKTANAVLSEIYHINEGVCVDTHVLRLSKRLGLSGYRDAGKVEKDLMAITPQKNWHEISHFLILHGRRVCQARKPLCADCVLNDICPSAFTF